MTKRAIIQALILLTGFIFESFGKGYGFFSPYLLTSYEASVRHYIYDICEHIKFIALVFLLWLFPARAIDFKTDGLFVVLAVLDLLDYLATGNDVWFGIGTKPMFPVSMNMVSISFFCLYAHYQWKINGSTNG